jgi:hypothetical protein
MQIAAGKELFRDVADTALRHPEDAQEIGCFTRLSFERLPDGCVDREGVMQAGVMDGGPPDRLRFRSLETIREALGHARGLLSVGGFVRQLVGGSAMQVRRSAGRVGLWDY